MTLENLSFHWRQFCKPIRLNNEIDIMRTSKSLALRQILRLPPRSVISPGHCQSVAHVVVATNRLPELRKVERARIELRPFLVRRA
jgi:hypothetical protein